MPLRDIFSKSKKKKDGQAETSSIGGRSESDFTPTLISPPSYSTLPVLNDPGRAPSIPSSPPPPVPLTNLANEKAILRKPVQANTSAPVRTNRLRLIVGIDFGTT